MEMMDVFRYGFLQRALLTGSLIAILCSVLGVFLVLRRLSLIGDGLSHVTFGSVAVTLLLGVSSTSTTLAAIPIVLLSAYGILAITDKARVYGDAAIGIVSALGIATGIMLTSLAGGLNVDLFSYLFGSILSISQNELLVCVLLFLTVLFSLAFCYNDLLAVTFDEELARTSGIPVDRMNLLLVMLTALTVVLAMRVVGIMLISALLILPAASALQLARGFKTAILLSTCFGTISVIGGIFASFLCNLPTGATIIYLAFFCFAVSFCGRRLRS